MWKAIRAVGTNAPMSRRFSTVGIHTLWKATDRPGSRHRVRSAHAPGRPQGSAPPPRALSHPVPTLPAWIEPAGQEADVARRGVTVERWPAEDGRPPVEIQRSRRRRKTVSAYARDGVIVVQVPAALSPDREREVVADLVDRVTGRQRAREVGGDQQLAARAARLADRYLDGVRPTSVRWSDRMQRRFGSCDQADGDIRISRRLARCPAYVLDAILIHELAHLQASGHGRRFRSLVARYPHHDRAEGFLEGMRHAAAGNTL